MSTPVNRQCYVQICLKATTGTVFNFVWDTEFPPPPPPSLYVVRDYSLQVRLKAQPDFFRQALFNN